MSSDNKTQAFYLKTQVVDAEGKQVDKKGVPPAACIVYAWNDAGDVARGVAICSEADNWNRQDGRERATARARKALGTKKSSMPIGVAVTAKDDAATMLVRQAGLEFLYLWQDRFGVADPLPGFKVSYNPALNDFEKKLVQTAKDRVAGVRTPDAPQVTAPAVG
jgi:hypothetical protein